MLTKILHGFAAPKHRAATQGPGIQRRPGPERMGRAFMEFIDRYPSDRVPDAGGVNATAVVLIPSTPSWAASRQPTSTPASPSAPDKRDGCVAGEGDPRRPRRKVRDPRRRPSPPLLTRAQRVALIVRDRGCTTDGCEWPPGMCHAHHDHPWALGGNTDLKDGRLLCPNHHARAHDPAFTVAKLPSGKVAFHRRT